MTDQNTREEKARSCAIPNGLVYTQNIKIAHQIKLRKIVDESDA